MNNKGVAIAIEQIVIIIISIVILSMGVAFVFKLYGAAEQKIPSANQQVTAAIERALSSGKVVEIPSNTKKIAANEMAVFNIGIKNDPSVSKVNDFFVIISFNTAVSTSTGAQICTGSICVKGMLETILIPDFNKDTADNNEKYSKKFTILPNQVEIISLGIIPNNNPKYSGRGQYFYNVCVCNAADCGIDKCNANQFSAVNPVNNPYGYLTFSTIVN